MQNVCLTFDLVESYIIICKIYRGSQPFKSRKVLTSLVFKCSNVLLIKKTKLVLEEVIIYFLNPKGE